MSGPFSLAVMVPLVVTVLVVTLAIVSTTITVRRERRLNAVLAARWATKQRRGITTRRAPLKRVSLSAGKRGAA